MNKKKVAVRITLGIAIAMLIYLGVALLSVTDSPDLKICGTSLGAGDNQYNFGTANIFDYTFQGSGSGTTITYEGNTWKVTYPRSTPASPACGTLTFPDGHTEQISNGQCTSGIYEWSDMMWSKGELTNDTDSAEVAIPYCFSAYSGATWACTVNVDVPKNLIDLSFDGEKLATFVGQDVQIPLIITNDWTRPITGHLDLEYMVETPFGNSTKSERIEDVTYNVGETEVVVTIPTGNVAEFMWFRGIVTTEITDFSGFHSGCYNSAPLVESIGVRTFDTDWQRIVVNPKPLYLEVPEGNTCDSLEGYDLNEDKTFCIRDDIADLGCMQVGCPVFENMTNDYFCTSAGVCAETVYEFGCRNDSDCDDFGAVCLESAFSEEDNFCVKTEIKEIITEIPQPIFVERTCEDIDYCAEGYTCVDDELDDGTPFAVCSKNTFITQTPWTMIAVIFGIFAVVVILLLVIRKK